VFNVVMAFTMEHLLPNPDQELARTALISVRRVLAEHEGQDGPVTLTVADGAEPVVVPRAAIDLLVSVLGNMAAGQSVSIVPLHAELTTQQAAEILNVSRPFVVKMLDEGRIAYRLVGAHRRIRADSLLEYQRENDARGRAAADELVGLSQEMGLTR